MHVITLTRQQSKREAEESQDNAENNQTFLQNMNIPYGLNGIEPRATQVWNCDLI